ncbi:GNAT family N-acetyltransferase [Aerosakkonema sp. BLCC-F183]|uniref:GNAT family N-acetyltransferase n=1 Tax=Aerosakkonema sp. BLCC-F183 TaxID=3342834 RepID=UPI0035BB7B09
MTSYEKNDIIFRTLQPEDVEDTVACLCDCFPQREPMTKLLGITYEEYRTLAEPYCQKAAQEKLSLLAKDKETNQICGFIISEDWMSGLPEQVANTTDKLEVIYNLLLQMDEKYQADRQINKGEILHISMLGVMEEYERKNIASKLVIENLKLAKSKNYKTAVTEATSLVSQHIFKKLGFQEELEIEYKSYTFEGKKFFESLEEHKGCILLTKNLDN